MVTMHGHLLHNDSIHPASATLLTPGQTGLLNGWGVFSTMRVIDGVPFAYERHWARMKRDAEVLRVPMPVSPAWLEERLMKLVAANQARNATLRVCIVRNKGGNFEGPAVDRDFDVIAFTTGLRTWGSSVKLGLVEQGRHAASPFAGTKMLSWSFNLVMLEKALCDGFGEVVLLNELGNVSECTSANIFATFGNEVLTPPLTAGCLPGVTRAILLEEIRVDGIGVKERDLTPDDLEDADEVFVTSTTRELLPVESIAGLRIKGPDSAKLDSARRRLQTAFTAYMREYAESRAAAALST